jgi:hypothetical protein
VRPEGLGNSILNVIVIILSVLESTLIIQEALIQAACNSMYS